MKSSELVAATVEFRRPERLPFGQRNFDAAPDGACDIREGAR